MSAYNAEKRLWLDSPVKPAASRKGQVEQQAWLQEYVYTGSDGAGCVQILKKHIEQKNRGKDEIQPTMRLWPVSRTAKLNAGQVQ